MLVAFFSSLHSSKLLNVTYGNVLRMDQGYSIRMWASKTDLFRSGATVSLAQSGDPTPCAVPPLDLLGSVLSQSVLQTVLPVQRNAKQADPTAAYP